MKKQFVRTCGNISTTAWNNYKRIGHAVSVDVMKDPETEQRYLRLCGAAKRCDIKISREVNLQLRDCEDQEEAVTAFRMFGLTTCLNSH